MKDLRPHMRVKTPRGYGTIVYVRMRPPEYSEVAAASVKLDDKDGQFGYCGTMFSVDEIEVDQLDLPLKERQKQ